jgi:hypothetical protein
MISIDELGVFRLLVAIATVLCSVMMLVPNHATERVTLTAGTS